jgi:putative transposase
VRLNSAIGYIRPKDMLAGHQQEIQAERDWKLDAAREQRKNRHQRAAVTDETGLLSVGQLLSN